MSLTRFWNHKISGVPGAALESSLAAAHYLLDVISTFARSRNLQESSPGVIIGHGVVLRNPRSIFVGRNVRIGRHVVLSSELPEGKLALGDGTWIADRTRVDFTGGVTMGRNCTVSADVLILTHDHGLDPRSRPAPKRLRIEDDVWIGASAIILQNVACIGQGATVAAGAVVTKDVPPASVVAGNPAKPLS